VYVKGLHSLLNVFTCPPCDSHCVQFKFEDFGANLDITTDVVDFDEIDDDLGRFQQDEIVKEALEKVSLVVVCV
jgi:hypothetical protein